MKKSLISLSIAVLVLILSAGLYAVAYLRLGSDSARLEGLETEVRTKTALLEQHERSQSELAGLPNKEADIEQYFVSKQNIVPFLEALQTSGKPLGASIDVLSVSNSLDGTHPRLTLPLTITGSFDAVMRTLGAIENGPYDGVLTNVTVNASPSADSKAGSTWTASAILSLGTQATSTKP